jgi:hypothetical protein
MLAILALSLAAVNFLRPFISECPALRFAPPPPTITLPYEAPMAFTIHPSAASLCDAPSTHNADDSNNNSVGCIHE